MQLTHAQFKEQVDALNSQLGELADKNKTLQAECATWKLRAEEGKTAVEQLEAKAAQTQEQHTKTLADLGLQYQDALEETIEDHNKELATAASQVTELKAAVAHLEQEKIRLMSRLSQEKQEVGAFNDL